MAQKNKHVKHRQEAGRPSKLTTKMRQKIEVAAIKDFNDTQICLYVGISRDTLYRWIKENTGLSDRIEILRNQPRMIAKEAVIKGLRRNPEFALKFLERREPEVYSLKSKSEYSGNPQNEQIAQNPLFSEAIKAYEEVRDRQIKKEARRLP